MFVTTDPKGSSLKSFVKVTGVASLEIEPDVIEFCVKITSNKPDLAECRSSVKKREEYISSVLKRNSIQEINSHEMIHKTEKIPSEISEVENSEDQELRMEFVLEKELFVKSDRISKYLNVVSTCNEKLDFRVEVSQPVISFSTMAMDRATKTVLQLAASNGKLKAANLIQDKKSPFKASIGPVLFTTEDSFQIQDPPFNTNNSNFALLKWKKFNRCLNTQITIAYELITSVDKRFKTVI
ncbi:unnamed protein product [Allacma fusca]|uniref:Uncharacterized protein n=1 Tax=Allacma fusca TaxID=39272 RepID=A0A8J2NR48_9HEXA|nr:unnamed protein product [Allacma fusca]